MDLGREYLEYGINRDGHQPSNPSNPMTDNVQPSPLTPLAPSSSTTVAVNATAKTAEAQALASPSAGFNLVARASASATGATASAQALSPANLHGTDQAHVADPARTDLDPGSGEEQTSFGLDSATRGPLPASPPPQPLAEPDFSPCAPTLKSLEPWFKSCELGGDWIRCLQLYLEYEAQEGHVVSFPSLQSNLLLI